MAKPTDAQRRWLEAISKREIGYYGLRGMKTATIRACRRNGWAECLPEPLFKPSNQHDVPRHFWQLTQSGRAAIAKAEGRA